MIYFLAVDIYSKVVVWREGAGSKNSHHRTVDRNNRSDSVFFEFFFSKTGGESGAKGKTDNNGNLTIESRNFDPSKLVGKQALYYNSSDDVTLVEDETIYITVKMRRLPK